MLSRYARYCGSKLKQDKFQILTVCSIINFYELDQGLHSLIYCLKKNLAWPFLILLHESVFITLGLTHPRYNCLILQLLKIDGAD